MARPFAYLRMRLADHDISYSYLASDILHKSESYICERMLGRRSWDLEDQYAIMDAIDEPYERLHIVFPPKGKAQGKQRDVAAEARETILQAIKMLTDRVTQL